MARALRNVFAMALGLVLGGGISYLSSFVEAFGGATGHTMPPSFDRSDSLSADSSPPAGHTGATPQAGR